MSEQNYDSETVKQVWQMTKVDLEASLSPAFFNTWIVPSPLTSIKIEDDQKAIATISCMTAFHVTNLKTNLYSQIKSALEKYINKPLEIEFLVTDLRQNGQRETEKKAIQSQETTQQNNYEKINTRNYGEIKSSLINNKGFSADQNTRQSPTVEELFSQANINNNTFDRLKVRAQQIGLRQDYTFESFAVSSSNEMAHAAATAVANNPGTSYNPLFLYGGVGVGKTHLIHAVAHHVLENNPEAEIIYASGEQFTNEIVKAIKTHNTLQLKNKYRKTNLLLLDDIQFIAGKNSVQEEFFHTFNALTSINSQIILTSDRPPQEISLLEDRLRSRFEAGLMIDIQQPTFELRTAIFLLKAQASKLDIPIDLAQKIASQVDSARRIEGIIKKIRSAVELQNLSIDSALIDKILQTEVRQNQQKIIKAKPQDIIKTVANHYRMKQSAVRGKRRSKELVKARHIAMYLLRNELQISLEEIGQWFSGRDHSSVIHAVKKIEQDLIVDHGVQQDVSAMKMSLIAISN
ncbi:MAG: chromosomal replication initiation protein [Candidatus Pacebacteria bacterium GW2011_GWF2_38_9]|nr:MAG: chromosomal replication initiation protein, chromosomal replication initiator protein [candidate division TM6 bacterium GW2011_GWF2_28_16]KKQ07366.1 MAG: chromosomal replication initiation protein [Candidatus Pacebacteria bacterium GW2011_GWF1_36_5]KKQ88385.1 MAG: chromosomal replication initiation protein [Candidatus Pacebacteria bacterium GW2011_GWF2_38_9]HAZ73002.1 chromosomal replication initiator protein DnaA [Candidatus Paceibacterota bacterium]